MSERSLPFYLDFISPYTWMALMRAEAFAAEHGLREQTERAPSADSRAPRNGPCDAS